MNVREGCTDRRSSRHNRKRKDGKAMETNIFEFRIINLPDGIQVIDTTLKTPYDALTPLQMVEYTEVDVQIAVMDRMRKKERMEAEQQQKTSRNLFHRAVCLFGLA